VKRVLKQTKASLDIPLQHHRWAFLGDSTMKRLFSLSKLSEYLFDAAPIRSICPQYLCSTVTSARCNMNEILNLPRASHWMPPNVTLGEGPCSYGKENPFCLDCDGCTSSFLWCRNGEPERPCLFSNTSRGMYGGYFSVEFARDVEVQTEQFATTQKSIAYYLGRDWNTEAITADFGRPICVVGAGHHDAGIPNITKAVFLTNVERYLNLLSAQCDHIIWLSNNSPLTDDAVQKINQTREWNLGVRDILVHRNKSSFVDVFEASRDFPHEDDLHMDSRWYDLLGGMLLQIVKGSTQH
jgi:hypothetical protein